MLYIPSELVNGCRNSYLSTQLANWYFYILFYQKHVNPFKCFLMTGPRSYLRSDAPDYYGQIHYIH